MFNWTYKSAFIFKIEETPGEVVPVSCWEKYQSDYLVQISILNELYENGLAEYSVDYCNVGPNEVLALSEIDKKVLGLPDHYPYEIYIQSEGQLNQSSFKFKVGFYDFFPNGSRFDVKRIGPVCVLEGRSYLLSLNQFSVCEAIEKFNALAEEERTFKNNLKCFADIKSFSKEAATFLDEYLRNQHVYQPEKIKIDIEFIDGILEIIPTLDVEDGGGFVRSFDKFINVKEVYAVSDQNGGTTRVIIEDKHRPELQKIKERRKISDEKIIEEVIEHPERFFEDDSIDFSVFYSERVKEIGIYKPVFYPFVCPYKSEWIPGIEIRDRVGGTQRIKFETSVELDEFVAEKEAAILVGKNTFEWQGVEIPIKDAEVFIEVAKKQFANPKEPVRKSGSSKGEEVLIIKENAELTEYVQNGGQPLEVIHGFSKIKNIKSSIGLKEHQVEGISWLQTLQKKNLYGCLLADDMGLGKTLQLLYFIEWHSQAYTDNKPYLIVAPVSLLENWENEYEKFFAPRNLPIAKLYGGVSLTKEFNQLENQREALSLQNKQIILTNYETLRSYQATIGLVDFAVVALDEAQKIKTPGTLVTNACKALKADFKIAMTGTPVENTLIDLWCIMDFSVPGLLGNAKNFAKEFQSPLKNSETDITELGERLRGKIGIYIKRRLKRDVAKDLPKKFDNAQSRIKRKMPLQQFQRYKEEIEIAKANGLEGADRRNQILKALWAIRDISDHPYLIDNQINNYDVEQLISCSAKLQILMELLRNIKLKQEKAIIFADRRETQRMLQLVVLDKFGLSPSIVNGDTPTTKKTEGKARLSRQQTIDRYQEKPGFNVIVMSPLAAGVGLNVTEANHVIHFTRHWNPAKEEQATDRAYRIGQQKDVHVYYPMAIFPDEMQDEFGKRQMSFDEVLDLLLDRKKSLATSTLFPSEQAEVKPDELFDNIFNIKSDNKPLPLGINQVDNLNPNLFEAFVAALYANQGFNTLLTPYANDKGVDVVALQGEENYLFQVKQTKSAVGIDAIQEIYTAKNYYENRFGEKFSLIVLTNSCFSSSAELLANSNGIRIIKRNELEKLLDNNPISIQDVSKHESQRMTRV